MARLSDSSAAEVPWIKRIHKNKWKYQKFFIVGVMEITNPSGTTACVWS
jgi:hypothetical protein